MVKPSWRTIQIVVSVAGLFAVLAIAAGVYKGALATVSVVVAYLLEFYVVRVMLRLVISGTVDKASVLIGVFAIAVSALLIYLNFWIILAMMTVCVFLMDALILRFAGVR